MMNGMEQARCVFQRRCFVSINPLNPNEMWNLQHLKREVVLLITIRRKWVLLTIECSRGRQFVLKFPPFEILHFLTVLKSRHNPDLTCFKVFQLGFSYKFSNFVKKRFLKDFVILQNTPFGKCHSTSWSEFSN